MSAPQLGRLMKSSALLTCVLIIGCQQANDDVEVSGAVTWNGKPLPAGMIILQPTEPRQPPVGGKIEDGKFLLHTKPGKMRVQVEAVRATRERDPETGTFLGEMYIPSRYNRETELEANITYEGKNFFEFALTN
jgi:hypothetical protein